MTTDRERRLFELQVQALREIETDEVPADTTRTVAWVNGKRAEVGIAPLERPDPPELELFRRARALGLRRIRR